MGRTFEWDGLRFSTVKGLRELRVMTQPELARAVGVHVDTIVNWEQGHTKPQIKSRRRLARALGIEVGLLYELLQLGPQAAGGSGDECAA